MSKVRINDLARDLEVKSKAILDVLRELGVTEKKTHSSSLEHDEAEKVKRHFAGHGDGARAAAKEEPKAKIDLSKVSKPGDVAALLRKKLEEQHAPAAPPKAAAPAAKPAAPVAA